MLADEGMASARAIKHMTKTHGLGKGLWKSKSLAPAFGTYAALGLTPLAITAGRKLLNRHREQQKTAGALGAMIGGAAGYASGGGSLKSKAIRTGVGALAGGAIGSGLSAAKRKLWDEPEARQHALAALPPTGDPNYVPTWQQGYQ
jgi:hypothetical protein